TIPFLKARGPNNKMSRRSVAREIRTIRTSLSSIARAVQRLLPAIEAGGFRGSAGPVPPPRKLGPPTGAPAAPQPPGAPVGYLRNLKPGQKAGAKALRDKKGIRSAIALARKLGSR